MGVTPANKALLSLFFPKFSNVAHELERIQCLEFFTLRLTMHDHWVEGAILHANGNVNTTGAVADGPKLDIVTWFREHLYNSPPVSVRTMAPKA